MKKVLPQHVFEDSSCVDLQEDFILMSVNSPHRWSMYIIGEEAFLSEKTTGIKLTLSFASNLEALAFQREFAQRLDAPRTTTVQRCITAVKEHPKTVLTLLAGVVTLGTILYKSRDYLKKGFDTLYEKAASEKYY